MNAQNAPLFLLFLLQLLLSQINSIFIYKKYQLRTEAGLASSVVI